MSKAEDDAIERELAALKTGEDLMARTFTGAEVVALQNAIKHSRAIVGRLVLGHPVHRQACSYAGNALEVAHRIMAAPTPPPAPRMRPADEPGNG